MSQVGMTAGRGGSARAAGSAALAAVLLAAGCSGSGNAPGETPSAAGSGTVSSAGPNPATSTGDTSTSPSQTPSSAPLRVSVGGSGDLLTHVAVRRSAEAYAGQAGRYDFRPMFEEVEPYISSADVALCHMETPLTSTNTKLSQPGILVFNTPHELADAVADAGYEGCDFASNHTWDKGLAGLRDTITVFDDAGLSVAGPGPSASTPRQVATYTADGVRVAHLAYTYTIFNNWGPNTELPADAPWLGDALWPATGAEGILRDAKQARADGADVVVVSLHWGQEYVAEPTAEQSELAHALLDSPEVDLILGTHVHRVQPCEKVNGKYVFYGLGNFLSNQSPQIDSSLIPQTQEGVYVQVDITRDADGAVTSRAGYLPTRVDLQGHVIRPMAKGDGVTFTRVTETLESLGNCPLEPIARR